MKKISIIAAMFALLLTSCKTEQMVSYQDDVYAVPSEEKLLAQKALEEKAKQAALERQQQAEAAAAEKAKEDANPYYKDQDYNSDDYYDYEYASRINRFQNPVYGAGYYDPYYTNMYTYNQNAWLYGTSIYSGYNAFMPSMQFGLYYNSPLYSRGFGSAIGFSYGSGYNFYNPYYSNPYWYDPYFGYSPWCGSSFGYPYGFGYGYNNRWNSGGWGYINSYDANTVSNQHYGPRNSATGVGVRDGGRSGWQREDNGVRRDYMESAASQHQSTPRFSNMETRSRSRMTNSDNAPRSSRITQRQSVENQGSMPANSSNKVSSGSGNNENNGNNQSERRSRSRITQRESDRATNNRDNTTGNRNSSLDSGQPVNSGNSGNSGGSGNSRSSGGGNGGSNGGGSSPRGGGGGGGNRPR